MDENLTTKTPARQAQEAEAQAIRFGTQQTNPVITPESLKPTPVATIVPPPEPSASPALASQLEIASETQSDAFTKQQQEASKVAETSKDSSLQQYLDNLKGLQGATTLTAQEFAREGGVDSITPELNDINDQIRREQLSNRRAKERIQERGGGLASGAGAEIGNLDRVSLSKQADLAVIQMAVQGRYDSAREIADRAVSAKLEQQNIFTEALRFNYSENKEIFNKAEQREFETLLGNRDRAIAAEKENLDSIYNLGLQAQQDGAPTDVVQRMMASKTKEGAMAIGGSYIGALDREAQRASINASIQSTATSRTNQLIALAGAGDPAALAALGIVSDTSEYTAVDGKEVRSIQKEMVGNPNYQAVQKAQTSILAISAYEKLFNEVGTTSGVTSPFDNARLKKTHKAALLDLKEFFNLGVLNGPDLEILTDVLGDPTNQGFVTNVSAKTGAEEGLAQMKTKLSDNLDDRFLTVMTQYGTYNPADVPLIEDTRRVYVQSKAALDPKVQALIDENPDLSTSEIIQIINSKL